MSLVKTGLLMNWVNCTVTPQGGQSITLDGVTAGMPMRASKQEVFFGDNRMFPRFIKNTEKKRSFTLSAANISTLLSVPEDTPCTVVGVLADPRNGIATGGGALQFTYINAVLEKNDNNGQNNKYATGSVTFNCYGGVDQNNNEIDPMSTVYL